MNHAREGGPDNAKKQFSGPDESHVSLKKLIRNSKFLLSIILPCWYMIAHERVKGALF